jgi:hypothetical protein
MTPDNLFRWAVVGTVTLMGLIVLVLLTFG